MLFVPILARYVVNVKFLVVKKSLNILYIIARYTNTLHFKVGPYEVKGTFNPPMSINAVMVFCEELVDFIVDHNFVVKSSQELF